MPAPATWNRVSGFVDAVLQLPPPERARYLDAVCDEPELRAYIDALVLPFAEERDFLAEPAWPRYAMTLPCELHEQAWVGCRIGDYRIEEQIGEGGMGKVFRAARADDHYRKYVAIKLLKEGYETGYALARFRSERQILANLEHPYIARLLDGGQTDRGFPYFVMELVDGEPIDQYCDSHKLSIDERLNLFCMICSAVEYAHQNLVIHRDLKPGNILVTAEGIPKLLDFGIARLLTPDPPEKEAERTVGILRIMTPEYASPEQIRGEAITTSSDVYALGVLLYLLLTGRRPYQLIGSSPASIAEVVCNAEPLKPSVVVGRTEIIAAVGGVNEVVISPESICSTRGVRPEKLRRKLAGDLDNLLLKSLRKEPQRRYASVGAFSRDIQLHLQNLPVLAHQDTLRYRTEKFVRRHRTASLGVVLLVLSLAAGVSATLHQARIARLERGKAERRFNDVRVLANSLMFDVHDSIQNMPGSTPARKLLVDRALRYLDGLSQEAAGDPSLQRELATAYEKVGDVQGFPPMANLGDITGALNSYDKALTILIALDHVLPGDLGIQHMLAGLYFRKAWCLEEASDFAGALASIHRAVPITEYESLYRSDVRTLDMLAGTYQVLALILTDVGDLNGALDNYQKAVDVLTKVISTTSGQNALLRTHRAGAYCKMSVVYELKGQLDPALEVADQGLQELQQLTQNDPENATLRIFNAEAEMMAASVQTHKGLARQAFANLHDAQQSFLTLSAADPSNVALSMDLAWNELHSGDAFLSENMPVKARESFTDALAVFDKLREHSGSHDDTSVGIAHADVGIARVHWMIATQSKSRRMIEFDLAQSFYRKSISILSDINGRAALAAPDQVIFRQAVAGSAACDRVLAIHRPTN